MTIEHNPEENPKNTFTNKVALVTGGTSGIGSATALAFAREGAKVVVSGRREKEGNGIVSLIKKNGGEGMFIKTDVSSEADVAALVAKTLSPTGGSTPHSTTPASKAKPASRRTNNRSRIIAP